MAIKTFVGATNTCAVGARGESSYATGVNGNQADNTAPGAGAVIGLFITCLSTAVSIPASAQSMFDMMVSQAINDPTTLISLNEYGNFIQAVSGPFSLPGVSSATF